METETKHMVKKSGSYLLGLLAGLFLFSASAFAQAANGVSGCNPAVLDAQQKKAQASVALDVAQTEQTVVKPDSVAALVCGNRSAGGSAERAANFFSGSFLANTTFSTVIESMLTGLLGQFADAEGLESGVVDYAMTTVEDNPACDGVDNLWQRLIEKAIAPGIAFLSLADMIAGVIPGGSGTKFSDNLQQAIDDRIFSDLNAAIQQLPRAGIPDFSTATNACDVLSLAGVTIACP
ncbi:MAG TPA: hypothetical protein VHP34_00260 [Alphaproteobacteria bacterium]|jgi:hypothetical protein|nr:hypothetical protein [Alphaproteobacteria bacterium]